MVNSASAAKGAGVDAAMLATVGGATAELSRLFRLSGVESAEQDARRLVMAAAGVSREELVLSPARPMSEEGKTRLADFAARRLLAEPVSRIVGVRAFYGREFLISPATLDPRPETETLVDAALEVITSEGWQDRPLRIADVGTGTGCLLLTLLAELPVATGIGTDVSEAALDVARRNAASLGLSQRAEFATRRSLATAPDGAWPTVDLLVTNPPYITSGAIEELEAGVRDYDPRLALDGGGDGLEIYREIAAGLVAAVPEGWAIFEVGAGQADAVGRLLDGVLARGRMRQRRAWRDLGGHARCVAVRTQL